MTKTKLRTKGYPSLITAKGLVALLLLLLAAFAGWFWHEWQQLETEDQAERPALAEAWPQVLSIMQDRSLQLWAFMKQELTGDKPDPEVDAVFEPATEEMARTARETAMPLYETATKEDAWMDAPLERSLQSLKRTWTRAEADFEDEDWSAAHGRYQQVTASAPGIIAQSELIGEVARRRSFLARVRDAARDKVANTSGNVFWEQAETLFQAGEDASKAGNYAHALDMFERAGNAYIGAQGHAYHADEYEQAQREVGEALKKVDTAMLRSHGGETWAQVLEHVRVGRSSQADLGRGVVAYRDALRLLPLAVQQAEQARDSAFETNQLAAARSHAAGGNLAEAIAAIELLLQQTSRPASPALRLIEEHAGQSDPSTPIEIHLPIRDGVTLPLLYVRPGAFQMGSAGHQPDEKPVHTVMLSRGFWMGKFEVTRAQYLALVAPHQSSIPDPDHPIARITPRNAEGFCRRLSEVRGIHARLPTEAEWEYVCRAGTTTDYSFAGGAGELARYGNVKSGRSGRIRAVGMLSPNPWGFHDMHGNVFEWVSDNYAPDAYRRGDVTDPTGPATGSRRVIRGGAWRFDADLARSASRFRYFPDYGSDYVGFRVVVQPRD